MTRPLDSWHTRPLLAERSVDLQWRVPASDADAVSSNGSPSSGRSGRPTIKQIAAAAGVSRGTVDRALNRRGDVNAEVAERIRRIADKLGYAPHRAAKALRLNHSPQTIGVLLPRTSSAFFSQIEAGVREAEREFADMGIHAVVDWFDPLDEAGFVARVETAVGDGVGGLVLTGPQTAVTQQTVRAAVDAGVAVVTTNSDLPQCGRIAFVGQDLEQSGRVAAELMAKLIGPPALGRPNAVRGRIIALTGSMTFKAHRDRVNGFVEGIAEWLPGVTVAVAEGRDQYEQSADALRSVATGDVVGAFAATGSIRALVEARRTWPGAESIRVITNDDLPVVREGLRSGEIDYTVLQDARMQGSEPIRILAEHLLTGTRPEGEWIRTPVVIAGLSLLESRVGSARS